MGEGVEQWGIMNRKCRGVNRRSNCIIVDKLIGKFIERGLGGVNRQQGLPCQK